MEVLYQLSYEGAAGSVAREFSVGDVPALRQV
jgi:hypothetical protein